MPQTPPPWIADPVQQGVIRIAGPAGADGSSNLICVVAGANVAADAALIVQSPILFRVLRAQAGLLDYLAMVLPEILRRSARDVEMRLVRPALERVETQRPVVADVLGAV